jgi:hypothetical protein
MPMHKSFIVVITLISLPCLSLFAQTAWELKKDKDSILIYSRTGKDSKFNELKAVFDLPGNFSQLRSILEDVNHYQDWVYATKASHLIEKKNAGDLVYYSEISVPWPLSNRDFYSNTRIWLDTASRQLRISSQNVSKNYPVKNHLVRIPFLRAQWLITMPSSTRLHVEYTLAWNPGGSIPAWVANLFSTTGPFHSFSELRKKMMVLNLRPQR